MFSQVIISYVYVSLFHRSFFDFVISKYLKIIIYFNLLSAIRVNSTLSLYNFKFKDQNQIFEYNIFDSRTCTFNDYNFMLIKSPPRNLVNVYFDM